MSHLQTASTTATASGASEPTPLDPTTDELEHDVERHREELAATVHALGDKLDVKTQAGLRAEELADRATTPSGRPRPELLAMVGGAAAVVVALVWWRRHR